MSTEKQIEFDKVKELWAEFAITDNAKEQIYAAAPFLKEAELKKALRDTTDARNMLEKLGDPPLQNLTEIREIILIAGSGDCLTPYQLTRTERVLVMVERLRSYLKGGRAYDNPLAFYDENLDSLPSLQAEINDKILNEEVNDRATKELYEVRNRILRTEDAMKQKAEQVIRTHKDCMADAYYTLRNGRVCVPVKREARQKVSGSVIDQSSTGSTLFIEPEAVAKCFEELSLLKIQEENEVAQILYALSAMVADAIPVLEENLKLIEKLDYIFSKGKLSAQLDCTEPTVNLERRIKIRQGRHPLMDKNVNVPLDFTLGEEGIRGIVITGPNTGGKTVSIKTVMLNCYMAQCGLHVPCKEADLSMNSRYLSDIGDGQNLSENLSTFSAHIKNVLEILSQVDPDSFVIMDELGSGTDPAEGMGIAVAIMEELLKSKANFLVTTHYPEVKEYAEKTEHILNARMTFDRETLMPTYRMLIGEAGESCAFYIADRLGMPEEMLQRAVLAAYGEEGLTNYAFRGNAKAKKASAPKLTKVKKVHTDASLGEKFQIGDSVIVYPEKKTGIVCELVNEQGMLRVQVAGKKMYINHKRAKLRVSAAELYPEDYDFSIIFDTAENRKKRHDMGRKYTEEVITIEKGEAPRT